MKRHDRRVGQLIAALGKDLEHLVLALRVSAVGLEHHRERGESIAAVVREWAVQLRDEAHAVGIERFASAHENARLELGTLLEQPARALDAALKHRATKRELKVFRAQSRHRFDYFQPAQVGRVAHRRAPVAADER